MDTPKQKRFANKLEVLNKLISAGQLDDLYIKMGGSGPLAIKKLQEFFMELATLCAQTMKQDIKDEKGNGLILTGTKKNNSQSSEYLEKIVNASIEAEKYFRSLCSKFTSKDSILLGNPELFEERLKQKPSAKFASSYQDAIEWRKTKNVLDEVKYSLIGAKEANVKSFIAVLNSKSVKSNLEAIAERLTQIDNNFVNKYRDYINKLYEFDFQINFHIELMMKELKTQGDRFTANNFSKYKSKFENLESFKKHFEIQNGEYIWKEWEKFFNTHPLSRFKNWEIDVIRRTLKNYLCTVYLSTQDDFKAEYNKLYELKFVGIYSFEKSFGISFNESLLKKTLDSLIKEKGLLSDEVEDFSNKSFKIAEFVKNNINKDSPFLEEVKELAKSSKTLEELEEGLKKIKSLKYK